MVQFRYFENLEDVEFASDEVFMFASLHYFDGAEVITLDKPFQLIDADDIYVMTETIRENVLYNNNYCKINMEKPTYLYIQYKLHFFENRDYTAYYTYNFRDFLDFMKLEMNLGTSIIERLAQDEGVLLTVNPWLIKDKV